MVLPTIDGREEDLARCMAAYQSTSPDARIYIERNYTSCGAAWLAGADHAAEDRFDYLHLTADDLEPHPGWLEAAIETVDAGFIPAPLVYNPDGSLQSAGLSGFGCWTGAYADWGFVEGTTVPFLRADMWKKIGMIPVHYCSDLWVSHRGRQHGWETVVRTGMVFTHYNAMPGRDHGRAGPDTSEYLRLVREAS